MFNTEVRGFSDQNRSLRTARERINRKIAVVKIGGLESAKDTLDFGDRWWGHDPKQADRATISMISNNEFG